MANTKIQIKRSSSTSIPTDGSLAAGEIAYSYQSKLLYLGTANGAKVDVIGGKYLFDHINLAFDAANTTTGAYNYANSVGAAANSWANAVGTAGNSYAVAVGTAANLYAESVGTAANSFATSVGTAGNNWVDATFVKLVAGSQSISGDIAISGNLTISGQTTYANTQTLNIGDNIFVLNADLPGGSAPSENAGMEVNRGSSPDVSILWNEGTDAWTFTNDGTNYESIASVSSVTNGLAGANGWSNNIATSANAYASAVGTSANLYADSVGTAGNVYAAAVGTAGNAYAQAVGTAGNNYAAAVGTSANLYADAVGTAANTNAANASYVSTGTLSVLFGGTGINTANLNGVLFGNGTGPFNVTAAGADGEVLQSDQGIPKFAMLDGGVF